MNYRSHHTRRSMVLLLSISICANIDCVSPDCAGMFLPPAVELLLRGQLVDSPAGEPVTDALLGATSFTDGVPIVVTGVDEPETEPISIIRPAEDGSFEIWLALPQGGCARAGFSAGPRGYPEPEEIELKVMRGECYQSVFIQVNADTVKDLDFAGNVIELAEPVIVEPCTR